jgi:alkylhydroperoxidase family enzyme
VGRKSGISQEQIAHLQDYGSNPNFSETERLVLKYADQMTSTPLKVDDHLFNCLREQFSEAQLVELTACIAWENYRARFNHAFGIGSENFSAGALCALPACGRETSA